MALSFITLAASEEFVIGPPDAKFPFEVTNVSGGLVFTIPNPDTDEREADFQYVYEAGAKGFGHFIITNPYFEEYSPVFVTILGEDGSAPAQHAPTAQGETLSLASSGLSLNFQALLANDADADGDLLFITIVSPFTFTAPGGSTTFAEIFSRSPDLPVGTVLPADGSSLFIAADKADGTPLPYAELRFNYVVSDAYGGESEEVQALIKIGTPPPPVTGGYVMGTSGDDTIDKVGTSVAWQLAGGDGADYLRGGSANDSLNGGAGDDRIVGGAGKDLITGGAGADRVAGGAGDDTFLFRAGDLATGAIKDQIIDFEGASVAGGDLIRFVGFSEAASLSYLGETGSSSRYLISDGAHSGQLWIATSGVLLAPGDYVFVQA